MLRWRGVSLWFDLPFPEDCWCCALFHVFIGHLLYLWRNLNLNPFLIFHWVIYLFITES